MPLSAHQWDIAVVVVEYPRWAIHLTLWPLVLGALCYSAAALWFGLTLRHTPLPEEPGGHATTSAVADTADASIAR